ncbi:MAG: TetR/AcrR family transcriptional regulator [Rhizomicrobium sp.]|nr:TetR/AcrR family transcriptional regulator [Rhizomicrobium sp.]
MKVSRQQVAENRRKILDIAGKLFREKGFEAVSVADIMAGAGLTHGGFYGYFPSKDALIAHTLGAVAQNPKTPQESQDAFIARYLSCAHKDNPGSGCPVAALAGDVARMPPPVRTAMTAALAGQLEQLAETAEGDTAQARRQNAIGTYAALVGGLTLARMSNDETLSAEILAATGAFLTGQSQP